MSDAPVSKGPREVLLDRFVEGLRPDAHRAAGVSPVKFDMSLTPEDLYAVGHALLAEYDAAHHPAASAPVPVLTAVTPGSVAQAGPALILTVTGTGLLPTSAVWINGSPRVTTVKNPTELTVSIPATDITVAVPLSVTAVTPAPGGGTSNALTVAVTAAPAAAVPNPAPAAPQAP